MYMIAFYVPETHLEPVKNAIFQAGAGRIGNYSHCAWQIEGVGQFMPLAGSNAFIGAIDTVEKAPEYKVEAICDDAHIKEVVAALKLAHPYETPAYQVWQLEDI